MPSNKEVHKIIKRFEELRTSSERYNNENMWNELSEYMLNHQHNFLNSSISSADEITSSAVTTVKGAKKTLNLYDSTSLQAVQDLAAAFQGTLTNPATTWSKLRFQTDVLNDNEEANAWLEEVNRIIHNEFNESNFDTEIGKAYQSYVALGNMVVFHEQRENEETELFDGFRFTAVHLSEVAWSENKEGIVDSVYRKVKMTAKQAFEKWGMEIGDTILKALKEKPEKEFEFIHAIYPRDKKDVELNSVGLAPADKRPVASTYVSLADNSIIEDGGYYEMPIYVSRWEVGPREKYGRGPGHYALPDVKTLNRLKKRALESIDLQVRPPIFANQRDVFGSLDMRPGGISVVKDHKGVREFVTQARTDVLQFSTEELKNSIRSIFYLDKLLLPPRTETGEMTAFEVSQRIEQMQRVLGPTLSRLNNELLQPLIVRTFKVLLRNNALPEMPEILRELGVDVEIVFVNQLARAQQVQDVSSIQQWVANLAQLAQISPEVIDNIDSDGIARHTAKILGVPEVAVKSTEVVASARQQRAQQQAQAQALQQANLAADTAAKAGLNTTGEE